eukprot:GDKJ01025491.1.p1 GENE.GDKJ01025491.1~~GDKJ01025491.1.p1  ORF type:complete len:751 (-),score=138.02 GDKJ01025491.1:39-2291(-)
MKNADYYDLLQVSRSATPDEIATSFRDISRVYHPDKSSATEAFLAIRKAYEVLSDPELRAFYDRYGHVGVEGAASELPFVDQPTDNDISEPKHATSTKTYAIPMAPGSSAQSALAKRETRLERLETRVKDSLRSTKELAAAQQMGSQSMITLGCVSDLVVPLTNKKGNAPEHRDLLKLQSVGVRQSLDFNVTASDQLSLIGLVNVQNSLAGSNQFQWQWQHSLGPSSLWILSGWGRDCFRPDGLNWTLSTAITPKRQLTFSTQFANMFVERIRKERLKIEDVVEEETATPVLLPFSPSLSPLKSLQVSLEEEEEEESDTLRLLPSWLSWLLGLQIISCEVSETFNKNTIGNLRFSTGDSNSVEATINHSNYLGLNWKASLHLGDDDVFISGTVLKKLNGGDLKIGIKPQLSLFGGVKLELYTVLRMSALSSLSWKMLWAANSCQLVLGVKRTNTTIQIPITLFGGVSKPVLLTAPYLNAQLLGAYTLPLAIHAMATNLCRLAMRSKFVRASILGLADDSQHEQLASNEFRDATAHLVETRAEIKAVSRAAIKIRERETANTQVGMVVERALYGRDSCVTALWDLMDRVASPHSHEVANELGFVDGVKVVCGGHSVVCDVTDILQQRVEMDSADTQVDNRRRVLSLSNWSKHGLPGFLILEEAVSGTTVVQANSNHGAVQNRVRHPTQQTQKRFGLSDESAAMLFAEEGKGAVIEGDCDTHEDPIVLKVRVKIGGEVRIVSIKDDEPLLIA